ncbi:MAG: terminase family protein [Firmicutes bacterium]|nr:terminase family protein [Bacillota bacterium]
MNQEERDLIAKIKSLEKKIVRQKKKNRLLHYNKGEIVHLKQLAFHKSLKRNRWVFGGNRSGKTECGAAEAVYMARGIHPYRENRAEVSGWVVSLSNQVQRDVAQGKILDYLNPDWIAEVVMTSGKVSNPRGGVIDYILVKNVFGGLSRIGFKSCEMGRDKFQGTSLDFVWFDEEPPRDIYEECKMRVIDRKGDIFGTMTPLLGLTFVYNKIYRNEDNDGEVWCLSMEWADNPYLDQDEVEKVSRTMSESELASRRYGKFSSASGLVYYEFDESIHVVEPFTVPKEWYDKIAIDPGLNNPLSCHWYAVDGDGVVFVIAEHYEAGKDIGYHSEAIKAKCRALEWKEGFSGKIEALIDSAAGQKTLSSQKSVADLFFEKGIAVNTKVNKDLFSGIARVKQYLKGEGHGAKIYIFNTCVNMIREIKNYFWKKGDMPEKKDDHALDELRYYLMTRPEGVKIGFTNGKSAIALDKERLLRKIRRRK